MQDKKTYEEQKEMLKTLLDEGKIELVFYEKEIEKINNKIELKKQLNKSTKQEVIKKYSTIVGVIGIILFAIIFLFCINQGKGIIYRKKYEKVESFERLPSPVQEKYGKHTEVEIRGEKFDVDLAYSYTIYGRVVGTFTYKPDSTHNIVVPKDIGMVWGPLVEDRFFNKLQFTSTGMRSLQTTVVSTEYEWYLNMNARNYISNNHVIPSTEEVKALMHKVKNGDFIKIEGYLCRISGPWLVEKLEENQEWVREYGATSDYNGTNNNNCETIFITDIKWLKEK